MQAVLRQVGDDMAVIDYAGPCTQMKFDMKNFFTYI
jgi:hypothetical protein